MRNCKIIVCILFCGLLFAGMVVSVFAPQKEYSSMENRELTKKPTFGIHQFLTGKFQRQYEEALNDQFLFRDSWVSLAVEMKRMVGEKDINGVYLGKDGYLLEKYSKSDFDSKLIKRNVSTLTTFLNAMEKQYGKDHVSCIMVPSKTYAMQKDLPPFAITYNEAEIVNDISKQLDSPHIMYDADNVLRKHADEYIYYRTDHHWTTLGAFYMYQSWARQYEKKSVSLNDYQQKEMYDDFYGTTYNKVHVKVEPDAVTVFSSPKENRLTVRKDQKKTDYHTIYFNKDTKKTFNRYDLFFGGNTFQIVVNTHAKTGRTLFVVKDSFANCFVPFLLDQYDRIIMVDYRYGKEKVGKLLQQYEDVTDVMVLFNTEKFIQNTKLAPLGEVKMEKDDQSAEKEFNLDDFAE